MLDYQSFFYCFASRIVCETPRHLLRDRVMTDSVKIEESRRGNEYFREVA